ncbi:hypothetical protein J2Z20_003212 [Paenibacillus sediminis]|uniref:HEAT repeat domain-containing protein n=2 Tax=Paenibacillus sediminis TaxID=664909 RepID=A0ABS4H7E7_9BACL|nr:hypothetical protein [Paenibacillus sediminis]
MTRMLETERYGEAISLLELLLKFQGQDERHYEEWAALRDWLKTSFPQEEGHASNREEDEDDWSEQELTRRHVQSKLAQDGEYADKLLRAVMEEPFSDQALLALEQLAYIDQPEVDDALIKWLDNRSVHPLIQFRILQTLKRRGMNGVVTFFRGQEQVEVEVESVPLEPGEFPMGIVRILERVADQTEIHEPALFYFAQEMWMQFVMASYGTANYRSMLSEEDYMIDIWAAALHQTVSESVSGDIQSEEIRSLYGITDSLRFQFEHAYRAMKIFISGSPKG